jgi:guanine nucleotide-binding protein G(i) subunit alpha
MGCGMSTEEKEGKARNEEIENQLKRDKMMQRNEIKMLLLGMYNPLTRLFSHSHQT